MLNLKLKKTKADGRLDYSESKNHTKGQQKKVDESFPSLRGEIPNLSIKESVPEGSARVQALRRLASDPAVGNKPIPTIITCTYKFMNGRKNYNMARGRLPPHKAQTHGRPHADTPLFS